MSGSHPAAAGETELDMSTTTQIPTRTTPSAPTRRPSGSRYGSTESPLPSWPRSPRPSSRRSRRPPASRSPTAQARASRSPGFAQLTLVFSLIGVGIAAVMARQARRPRSTFVRTAVALTAVSFVPDLTFGFDAGSAATLVTLHTVAAAIVVPTLARRLARAR
jgi:amino acid transporter